MLVILCFGKLRNVFKFQWQPGTQRSGVTGESGRKAENTWIHGKF